MLSCGNCTFRAKSLKNGINVVFSRNLMGGSNRYQDNGKGCELICTGSGEGRSRMENVLDESSIKEPLTLGGLLVDLFVTTIWRNLVFNLVSDYHPKVALDEGVKKVLGED